MNEGSTTTFPLVRFEERGGNLGRVSENDFQAWSARTRVNAHPPDAVVAEAFECLDRIASTNDTVQLRRLIQPLASSVDRVRASSPPEQWRSTIQDLRAHAAFTRLLEDPYTHRAFHKPRGYAGDAVMLDYLYRPAFCEPVEVSASPAGRAIFSYTTVCPAARAVLNRRAIIARFVDNLNALKPVRVASLACGHLREAELMSSVSDGSLDRLFAIDQDEQSVEECIAAYSELTVHALEASVADLLKGGLPEVRGLDAFYAAGLFDYLSDRLAARLLAEMFSRVRSGGRILVANFVPETQDRGYMEAFMDWWLTYRHERDMERLTAAIPSEEVERISTFREAEANIVFLEVWKR